MINTKNHKVGDIVIVSDRKHDHYFEIGDTVEIKSKDDISYYATDGEESWYLEDDELISTGLSVLLEA